MPDDTPIIKAEKYDENRQVKPLDHDPVKAEAAAVFKTWWDKIRADEDYLQRKRHTSKRGDNYYVR